MVLIVHHDLLLRATGPERRRDATLTGPSLGSKLDQINHFHTPIGIGDTSIHPILQVISRNFPSYV